MNGDRYPKHLHRDDFEGPGDREQLRRWRRRQAQRALDRELRADVPGMTYAELRAFRERVEAAMREEDRIFGRTG